MAKMRVYDLAKELGVQPKELLELLTTIGVTGKVPSSSIEDTAARSLRQMINNKNNPQVEEEEPAPASPTQPASFENFRTAQKGAARSWDTEISSDVIVDFREQQEADDNIVVQGPAKSGPGARRDAASLPASYQRSTPEPLAPLPGTPAAKTPSAGIWL